LKEKVTKRSKKPFALSACSDLGFIYRSQTIALHTSTCSLRKKFTSIVDVFALNSNVGKQVLSFVKPRDIFNQNYLFVITRSVKSSRANDLGGIPCVFCELASEKCAVADTEPFNFSITINRNGFLSFCELFL